MSDTVEKHKTSMAIQNVKVYVAEVNQRDQRVVLCDDYMTLANKYDSLREMYGELTGKFFKSAERLSAELGKRQALLMKYEKKVQECQEAREIAFGYMQRTELMDEENQGLHDEIASIKELGDKLFKLSDKMAEELQKQCEHMDYKPKCLRQYKETRALLVEMCRQDGECEEE